MHLCVLLGSQNKQRLFLFTALTYINLSGFITEAKSVYCAVRTGSLNQTATIASLKRLIFFSSFLVHSVLSEGN